MEAYICPGDTTVDLDRLTVRDVRRMRKQGGERSVAQLIKAGSVPFRTQRRIQVQYFEIRDAETLAPLHLVERRAVVAIAATIGSTRLIDNLTLE